MSKPDFDVVTLYNKAHNEEMERHYVGQGEYADDAGEKAHLYALRDLKQRIRRKALEEAKLLCEKVRQHYRGESLGACAAYDCAQAIRALIEQTTPAEQIGTNRTLTSGTVAETLPGSAPAGSNNAAGQEQIPGRGGIGSLGEAPVPAPAAPNSAGRENKAGSASSGAENLVASDSPSRGLPNNPAPAEPGSWNEDRDRLRQMIEATRSHVDGRDLLSEAGAGIRC